MSICVKLEVYVTVKDIEEAEDVARDLHEILGECGVTNSVEVTDDISE